MTFAGTAAGLGTAASWGIGDFAGGIAARRQHVFSVVLFSQLIGLALMLGITLVIGEAVPPTVDLLWGAAAGVLGAVGVTALYASLAAGRMGVAAPITGVVAALVPIGVAWFVQGPPGLWGYAGIAVALAGLVLVSGPKAERPAGRVLALAITAGLGFAGFLIFMGLSSGASYFWTLTAARVGSAVGIVLLVLVTRPGLGRPGWPVLGAALGDTAGNAFFLLASRLGRLDVAVVLSSLYPVVTVLLAILVLRERLTWKQGVGSALLLSAIPMMTAA